MTLRLMGVIGVGILTVSIVAGIADYYGFLSLGRGATFSPGDFSSALQCIPTEVETEVFHPVNFQVNRGSGVSWEIHRYSWPGNPNYTSKNTLYRPSTADIGAVQGPAYQGQSFPVYMTDIGTFLIVATELSTGQKVGCKLTVRDTYQALIYSSDTSTTEPPTPTPVISTPTPTATPRSTPLPTLAPTPRPTTPSSLLPTSPPIEEDFQEETTDTETFEAPTLSWTAVPACYTPGRPTFITFKLTTPAIAPIDITSAQFQVPINAGSLHGIYPPPSRNTIIGTGSSRIRDVIWGPGYVTRQKEASYSILLLTPGTLQDSIQTSFKANYLFPAYVGGGGILEEAASVSACPAAAVTIYDSTSPTSQSSPNEQGATESSKPIEIPDGQIQALTGETPTFLTTLRDFGSRMWQTAQGWMATVTSWQGVANQGAQ